MWPQFHSSCIYAAETDLYLHISDHLFRHIFLIYLFQFKNTICLKLDLLESGTIIMSIIFLLCRKMLFILLINLPLICNVEGLIGETLGGSLSDFSEFILQPGLNCSNSFIHVERKHGELARHISFGGNLITFSPLQPLSEEQPKEV